MTDNSICAASLEAAGPKLGVPDLTEFRISIRPFPKDQAERDCYRHLLQIMRASPKHPSSTKAELEEYCRRKFGVTVESFEQSCWPEAITISGASWNKPGRRPC